MRQMLVCVYEDDVTESNCYFFFSKGRKKKPDAEKPLTLSLFFCSFTLNDCWAKVLSASRWPLTSELWPPAGLSVWRPLLLAAYCGVTVTMEGGEWGAGTAQLHVSTGKGGQKSSHLHHVDTGWISLFSLEIWCRSFFGPNPLHQNSLKKTE